MPLIVLSSVLSLPVILFALWQIVGRMGFGTGWKILMLLPGSIYFLYFASSEFGVLQLGSIFALVWLATSYVLFLLPILQAIIFLFVAFKKWPAVKAVK